MRFIEKNKAIPNVFVVEKNHHHENTTIGCILIGRKLIN